MAETASPDDLKKRARRRLVGAIALALTAAIVLPMVMDKEPRSAHPDLDIKIPAQDNSLQAPAAKTSSADQSADQPVAKVSESETPTSIPAQTAAGKPSEPAINTLPEKHAEDTEAPAEEELPPPPAAQAPAVKEPKEQKSVASAPNHPPKTTSTPKASSTPHSEAKALSAEKPAQRADEVAALLNGKAAEKASSVTNNAREPEVGSFFVQLGAYRDEDNIKGIQSKVNDAGMHAFTERAGDKTRVRLGPFPTRDQAEKAVAKLKQQGLVGVVATK